jgi:hypothetical protein
MTHEGNPEKQREESVKVKPCACSNPLRGDACVELGTS